MESQRPDPNLGVQLQLEEALGHRRTVLVELLLSPLKGCRDRFIQQGGGTDRSRCICSVLREAQEGNGGTLPEIDDWENIYRQLRCHRFEE